MLISALEHGDRVAVLERDHGLLPARRRPAGPAARHRMAAHLHGTDAGHRDAEQFLERVPDLVLIGLGVHLEGVHLARLVGGRALLGHHRADDDLVQGGHYLSPFFFLGALPPLRVGPGFEALAVLFLAAFALAVLFLAALAVLFLAALAAFAVLALAGFVAPALGAVLAAFGAWGAAAARRSRS